MSDATAECSDDPSDESVFPQEVTETNDKEHEELLDLIKLIALHVWS